MTMRDGLLQLTALTQRTADKDRNMTVCLYTCLIFMNRRYDDEHKQHDKDFNACVT